MTSQKPVRVIGVGTPHGDDAIGLTAIRLLRTRQIGAELYEADSGQRLLDFLDPSASLIIIDALKTSDYSAGTIYRANWPDCRLESLCSTSTHGLGVSEALKLADALGQLPQEVVIFAVAIEQARPNSAQNPQVVAALHELLRRIEKEIERIQDTSTD
jgi:hydrogenase maturation protease